MESNSNEQSTNRSGSNFEWEAEKQLNLENLSPEERQRRLDASTEMMILPMTN